MAHSAAAEAASRVSHEIVALPDSVGRVLAEPVRSLGDLPNVATSAMDGWIVAGQVGPWRVVGASLAGHPLSGMLAEGTAAQIATGGVVPRGAWGVLRREFATTTTSDDATWVDVDLAAQTEEPFQGSHIRPAGGEALTGDTLVPVGTMMSPAHIGLAAVAGNDTVSVRRPLTGRVLILGDEVERSGVPTRGRVRDAFGPQLPAFAGTLGISVDRVDYLADNLEVLREALADTDVDVIITTGGTAAGPADFLHEALDAAGANLVIDKIAMRPGHPMVLAEFDDGRFVVGLPGNPLSAMAGMLTLLRPLARGLRGLPEWEYGEIEVGAEITAPASEHRLVPYVLDDDYRAVPTDWLGSGMLRGLAGAQGVLLVPPGGAVAGDIVGDLGLPW